MTPRVHGPRRRGAVWRVVVVVSMAVVAHVAVTAVQTRDVNQGVAVAPTGVMRGTVVTDTAIPQPVRRATVTLSGVGVPRLVGTDDLGRFVFDALPAGRYTAMVSKPGFVRAFHGAVESGVGPGVPVAVAEGRATEVTIRLLPGASISGVVTDARGLPVSSVTVSAIETRVRGGALPAPVRVVTDDRGSYRLYGLAPGDYLVAALPQLSPAPGGRVGQSPGAVIVTTDVDVQAARNAISGPASTTSASDAPSPGLSVAYAPVYHPGTTDVASAAGVRVVSGEERTGIDLPLRVVRLARLAGGMTDDRGQPLASATVLLVPKRGDRPSPVDALVASGALALPRAIVSSSAFAFSGVAPGQYTLIARTGSGQRGVAAAEAATQTLWSVSDIVVDGTDQEHLLLRLTPGASVAGRVVFDAGATRPADLATLNLSLVATNPIPGVAATYRAAVQPDGAFRVPSVAPGAYLMRADAVAGSSRVLKSAMVQGKDLADEPLVAVNDGGDVSGVVVTFAGTLGEITGRLIDTADRPVTQYSMLVFTTADTLWRPGARRIRLMRPATDGAFVADGLPAGDYAIVAIADVDSAQVYDATFLSALLPSAIRVTLAEGEIRRQDFRVAGPPR